MDFFRRTPAPGAELEAVQRAEAETADLPPSRLRGTEPMYGYVVGLELLAVAIIQMVVKGGKGAPAHPQTSLQVVGIAASVAFFAVLQLRNRTVVGLAAIVAAFFVTLPRVPNSLGVIHILALVVPLAYGLIITQRQRKAMMANVRSGRSGRSQDRASGAKGVSRREAARAGAGSGILGRRRGKAEPEPTGPRPSARYTPPKAKRGKGKVAGR